MKHNITIFICLVLVFLVGALQAQINQENLPILPIKPFGIPMFGEDIVINDQPLQNQQKIALCTAYNGWLFAAVTYKDAAHGTAAVVTVLKSIDSGVSWTIVLDGWYAAPGETVFTSVDILAIGNSISNLKFVLALVATNNPTYLFGFGFVDIYNAETGVGESRLCSSGFCYDISLSSDYLYPAINSNPHSIGVLFAERTFGNDSLIFMSSSNGGLSLDSRQVVASTANRFHKVALNYGRSPSWSSGRYFAVWEEQDDFGYMPGRIFTAHSNPNFNSSFTTPVRLDAIDPANDNMCSNPAIACQYSNADNDSSNFTEIVMFDRFNQSTNKYDVKGYYNLQATNHSYFRPFSISDPNHNNYLTDVNFNPYDSTFMLTYVDSTAQKLPFLTKNFNLQNPNQWNMLSPGYNDNPNLGAAYPKVLVTSGLQKGVNVWIGQRSIDKGVALFDSPSHTWPGVPELNSIIGTCLIGSYPNPCSNTINIAFKLMKTEKIVIKLFSMLGQPIGIIADQTYPEGNNVVNYRISFLPDGTYLYSFSSESYSSTGKFSIIK